MDSWTAAIPPCADPSEFDVVGPGLSAWTVRQAHIARILGECAFVD